MSRLRPTEEQQAALYIPCERCGAAPGGWCTVRSGWSTSLHSDRERPVRLGWSRGFIEGMNSALDSAEAAAERGKDLAWLITHLRGWVGNS